MGKLINRRLGSCLLISSLPGSAMRMHVESLGKLHDVNKHSQGRDMYFGIMKSELIWGISVGIR